jgi:hypothetical protein
MGGVPGDNAKEFPKHEAWTDAQMEMCNSARQFVYSIEETCTGGLD